MDELRFQRLDPAAVLPRRAHGSDAGLDLCACEAASIAPGTRRLIRTGLAVAIPDGHAGLVLPRSGNALRHGISIVNAPGLIDAGYRGEVGVILQNNDGTSLFMVSSGDRIAQLVVLPIPSLEPRWAESLEESDRGTGGFGSTGS